jgi:hypothetical protein
VTAEALAATLRRVARSRARPGRQAPAGAFRDHQPTRLLSAAADVLPELGRQVEVALQTAEIKAVESATPTAGPETFLIGCREAGRQFAIVSNNTGASVRPTIESAWPVSSGTSKLATHPIQLS